MKPRHFLKIAFGIALGVTAATVSVQAAPLAAQSIAASPSAAGSIHPAVTTTDEVARLKPEQVRWHRHGGWHHHRHWGWHHRHWRHRHWGWRHHHWHRHWHHRHW